MPNPLISLIIAALLTVLGVWIFRPERGMFWRWQRARKMTARVLREDALKHIHQCEIHDRRPTIKSLAGALNVRSDEIADLLEKLEASDLLQVEGENFHLTPAGRDYALHIIRAHRLWERYLADATGFEEAEWHGQADLYEHMLSPDETSRLSARLGNPTHDPHGDPIPTADGAMVYRERVALPAMEVDRPARIVHIEDEPEAVFAQLVAEGLHVGMIVHMVESSSRRIRFWAGGDEHTLAPLIAANISVEPLPDEVREEETLGETLTSLTPGESGQVIGITPRIRGTERRRLMDLGILPGTVIEAEISSPSGDPVGYRVRGAVIALRSTQADHIHVRRVAE
ncbi:MAG: metal-dependent transcriptional regulator [Anaerolineales bacterium]|nr:metal-dependent transcriptional regulator [Anaerolineales bacterium]